MPTALITGVTGQDGSYLAELLVAKGYRVVGTTLDRNANSRNLRQIREQVEIVEADLANPSLMEQLLFRYKPEEIYNLAARASSKELWSQPVLTGELNAIAVAGMLDAIAQNNPNARFVQACSSEVFGNSEETPQSELTRFQPRNPYGVAKAYGHWITAIYREHRGLFACSCILYNHESPRRGLEFVTRKISRAAAMISLGNAKELRLGDLETRRDWGFAGDYVRAMWMTLQQPRAGEYIIATGQTHSVRDFCELAFAHVGLDYRDFVIEDTQHLRKKETGLLVGNPAKAHQVLHWQPSLNFQDLVRMMVDADLKLIRDGVSDEETADHPSAGPMTNR